MVTLHTLPTRQIGVIGACFVGIAMALSVASECPADSAVGVFYQWVGADESEPQEKTANGTADSPRAPSASDAQPLPETITDKLGLLQGIAYPNEGLFRKSLANVFEGSRVDYSKYENQIISQARQGPVESFYEIRLRGNGCGCSRDFDSVVYGFYPYWLATESKPQALDFSLFGRIAFYALTIDKEGNIDNPLQWRSASNIGSFINTAHKYRVDIDLTVYAQSWHEWTDGVIDHAVETITQTATQRFSAKRFNVLRSIVPLLEDPSSVQADGVTIYFPDFTKFVDAGKKVVDIVEKLSAKLQDADSKTKLNIMLDMDTDTGQIEQQKTVLKNISDILLADSTNHILIFLQEPTSFAKKKLRRIIEDTFRGENRKKVLRKIIPIISPAGRDKDKRGAYEQFKDDLIYFQDNFAGVGLWPLPLDSDDGSEEIKNRIIQEYSAQNGAQNVSGVIDKYVPQLCQFVCPNRWLFRLGFDGLAGLLTIYGVLAVWNCKLRRFYNEHAWYFLGVVAVTVIIFFVSLVCDPYWRERADAVLLGVLLAVVVYAIWKYVNKLTRPPLP